MQLRLNLRARTLLFLLSILFSWMVALVVVYKMEASRNETLRQQQTADFQQTVEKIFLLRGGSQHAHVWDYSMRDDMVNFVKSPNTQWAADTIDSSLKTYDADAAWVYRSDFLLVYSTQRKDISGVLRLPLPTKAFLTLVKDEYFSHFFADTPKGLIEVRGAPIQPSTDIERKAPPQGYFFVGRLWTDARIAELGEAVGGDVRLVRLMDNTIPEGWSANSLHFSKSLKGWDDLPAASLLVSRHSPALEQFKRLSRQELLFFARFAMLLLFFQYLFIILEITQPLRKLSNALKQNDAASVDSLARRRDEFGALANLARDFFAQQQTLVNEVTERKHTEQMLRQAQFRLIQAEKLQSVGRLAAGVAHEVKNPLAIILQGVDYLEHNTPTEQENCRMVATSIREAVKRADKIIHGMLDFSSISRLDIHLQPLNPIIEHTLELVHHEAVRKQIHVETSLSKELPDLALDRNKIEQVLVNVFSNAVQATPEGGSLTARAYATTFKEPKGITGQRKNGFFSEGDPIVVVEVDDTGSGIAPEHLKKLFEPFFTTKPSGSGTGLGLVVSRNILELHRGMIELMNRPEGGVRARLIFRLPMEQPQPAKNA